MRTVLFIAVLTGLTTAVFAQQTRDVTDLERTEIHTILRRFYFNLDRKDWEALTSDILPAKVMAVREPLALHSHPVSSPRGSPSRLPAPAADHARGHCG